MSADKPVGIAILALVAILPIAFFFKIFPISETVTPDDFKEFVPPGYKIVQTLKADFNRDGQSDFVVVMESIDEDLAIPLRMIVFQKEPYGWLKLWSFKEREFAAEAPAHRLGRGSDERISEPVFEVRDLTGDGELELVFSTSVPEFKEAYTHVFGHCRGVFRDLVWCDLEHDWTGGVIVEGERIIYYNLICPSDPQERVQIKPVYYGYVYQWNGQRYVFARNFQGRDSSESCLDELLAQCRRMVLPKDTSFEEFLVKFREAVLSQNRRVLREMMAENINYTHRQNQPIDHRHRAMESWDELSEWRVMDKILKNPESVFKAWGNAVTICEDDDWRSYRLGFVQKDGRWLLCSFITEWTWIRDLEEQDRRRAGK